MQWLSLFSAATVTTLLGTLALGLEALAAEASDDTSSRFSKQVLSEDFFSEGACFADLNGDGHQDVVSGPYWYEGPAFTHRHAYASIERFPIAVYSRHFFSFAHDFNGDKRPDILVIPMPGQPAHWFENPGSTGALWNQHLAFGWVGNESPALTDLTGDGRPELIFCYDKRLGYAEPNWNHPTEPWTFTAISGDRGFGRFTHGLGVGDVNGDGRLDVLETNGWWEQPETKGALFTLHPVRFAEAGGAQMFTDDVDGDGDQDVLSVQNAHGYGLCWFENVGSLAQPEFQRHDILTQNPNDNAYGLSISQMHAAALVDIDGDGRQDLVTGKRFWAHGGGDPGSQELPLLYWFQNRPTENGVEFRPWLIDQRSGVGTQLTVGDLSGDGAPDIVIGNKLGTFVFTQKRSEAKPEAPLPQPSDDPQYLAGTDLFAEHVRSTEPLSPAEEQASFVLPEGFEIQLVASEPDIAKPMNLAFDSRGRLWVSSSLEYPYAAPGDREGRDTIKILEDTTGDGYADKITTFADGLNIPIGLYPYRDGVVCFSIPNIWFLRDTDGDDRADVREKLYGPFDTTRDTHGMCNAFTKGLDGWLYACHGFNNQSTVSGTDGHAITMQSGNTFRMRLDGSRLEQVGHGQVNPFGMTFDRFGDLLTADCHTKPINLVLPGGYHDSFGKPHDGLGYVPNVMEHLHRSTGIAGVALGEATHFPQHYRDCSFGGNVVTSRINMNRLHRRGSSIVAEELPDFLIPGDPWFRPVDLAVGPDGALYVADFYNAIIGHYEVPLTHPRRDRFRGRIWKISYRPKANTDPNNSPAISNPREAAIAHILESLSDANPVRTSLLIDELATRDADAVATEARQALETAAPHTKISLWWVLHRTGHLKLSDIEEAARSDQPYAVRVAAYRLLAAQPSPETEAISLLARGLTEELDPLVLRSAVMAATQHPTPSLIMPLLGIPDKLASEDVHGHHTVKIALKHHLKDPSAFVQLQPALSQESVALLADVCLAVDHAAASRFLITHLDALTAMAPEATARYVRFAARSAQPADVASVVSISRRLAQERPSLSWELLQSIRSGLEQQGLDLTQASPQTDPLRAWASELAEAWLGSPEEGDLSLPWTSSQEAEANPWAVSTRRASADGQTETRLWSSFPRGEQRTGSYRSASFILGEKLEFYLAGHDGPPGKAPQGRNHVLLREADSDRILFQANPPRNDTAQRILWDTRSHQGQSAYVELVDGDTGTAYAWLAAGRFSIPGLNPSDRPDRQKRAASLIEAFRLTPFDSVLGQFLTRSHPAGDAVPAMARAYTALRPDMDPHLRLLGNALDLALPDLKLKEATLKWLTTPGAAGDDSVSLLRQWMNALPQGGQRELAERLARSSACAPTLLALIESGQASSRLLQAPSVTESLAGTLSQSQQARLRSLVEALPDEDANLAKLIAARIAEYRRQGGDIQRGQDLFSQHCAVCHQVAGAGTVLGPNLDGIGNRGLARITEDVLAPNRNVDVAFRLTTLTLRSGDVHVGLVRGREGAQWIVADPTGKEARLAAQDIAEQTTMNLSLMPATFADALSTDEFRDLQAYLLSLRN